MEPDVNPRHPVSISDPEGDPVTAAPPHPYDTWPEALTAENERAAELAAELERARLERDRAKAEGVGIARRYAAFKEELREIGELASAEERHLFNAMRHARANLAGEDRRYDTLSRGLVEALNEKASFSPAAQDASTPAALLAAVRAEIAGGRAHARDAQDNARAMSDLVREMARALDMPTNTSAANVVNRAAALRREAVGLRRTIADLRREREVATAKAGEAPPTWDDVKSEFGKVVTEIGQILREAVDKDR